MKIIRDDIWVCDDCLFAIENGHTFSIESEERVAEVWKGVRRLGRHLSANWDSETDEGIRDFSWSSCDCCGSRLGGERHRYAVLGPDTKKKTPGTKAKRVASAKTTKSGGGEAWLLDRSKWTLRAVLKSPSQSSVGGGGAKTRASRGAVARYVDPHETPGERASFNRWFGNKYGLSPVELDALHKCHRIDRLEQELDAWRQAHGWLTTNSPLARGKLMDLVRSGKFT